MPSGFHEVRFPLRLSLTASGGPMRRTDIVNLSNGREVRNARFAGSRRAYDAGSGIRSVADLHAVLEFYEARGGGLHGFRFRDPVDWKSCPPGETPDRLDQRIGTGDGVTAMFQLARIYGDAAASFRREIAKPVAGSVVLAVAGVAVPAADVVVDTVTGRVTFQPGHVPAAGAAVTAGFEFDVPVRFDAERIDISLQGFQAGRIPTIPLLEIAP